MPSSPPCRPALVFASARAAFRVTIPILIGFGFCGFSYGLYMRSLGFEPIFPILMALTIFAGSLEFIMASMLTGSFAPLTAFVVGLIVNARHLFYGIAMLDRYRALGAMRFYLIFGLTDETFSINCATQPPAGVHEGWFMFFVTLLNHLYWTGASAVGALLGSLLPFNTEGLDFVMTAMFVVIFLEAILKEKQHISSLIGVGCSVGCLLLLGADDFMLPTMGCILLALLLTRRPIDKLEGGAVK